MKVVIIEDEINAFEYLFSLLKSIEGERKIELAAHLDSVKSSVNFFQNNSDYELTFMDIQIADGLSFEIFNHTNILKPVIFTTAFDEYAIDAFKVHSIDYLLKPIHIDELRQSMEKYHRMYSGHHPNSSGQIVEMLSKMTRPKKNRCLVKKGGHFEYVKVEDIGFVVSEDSITFLYTLDGSRFMYSKTVEQLYDELDPDCFYQINRSQIVNIQAINQIHPYLNQRLKLQLSGTPDHLDFIVSRKRMSLFKEWMDR